MDAPGPVGDLHPGSRADTRISLQVRRFAVVWLAVAIAATLLAAFSGWVTGAYRTGVQQRAGALTAAQQRSQLLETAVLRQLNDELQWRLNPGLAYAGVLRADLRATGLAARALTRSGTRVRATGGRPGALLRAAAAAYRWQAQAAAQLAAGQRPGASGDRTGVALAAGLASLPPRSARRRRPPGARRPTTRPPPAWCRTRPR